MINFGNIIITDLRLGATQVKAAYFGDKQIWGGEAPVPTTEPLCFTAQNQYNTIYLQKNGSPDDIYLEKSTDGTTWSDLNYSTVVSLSAGEKLYIRAKSENQTIGSSSSNYYKFVTSNGKFAVSGNIQSLLKADGTRTDAPAYCYYRLFSSSHITTAPELPATTLANYCYSGMFQQCTYLTAAPALPVTTIADYCYVQMFSGCTSLTTAPALPATTLADHCYSSMFQNCSSLTSAPALPATTLASNCYNSMFRGCTSLTTAPALLATTLASSCYSYMFDGCTSLTTVPATLPAMTLVNSCYQNMFSNCTSLTTAPTLPATTLADYCYWNIFQNCTSLTAAPKLPATTLASGCYQSMFNGCTSLNSVEVAFTDWNKYGAVVSQNWLQNVAATGTFTCPTELSDIRDDSHIPVGWQVVNPAAPLCFTATSGYGYIKLGKNGSPDDISLEVSRDNIVWNDYTIDNGIQINSSNDNKLYFRAKGQNQTISKDFGNYYSFIVYASIVGFAFEASGNIQTLLKADGSRLDAPAYCYYSLFNDCRQLTSAPLLLATTLANWCYSHMFKGCISLTSAPALPATTLAERCYNQMFSNCTSLTTAPTLPATTLANDCYQGMFSSCSSLTTAPTTLPATTLAIECYWNMFQNCTSLTTAPVLPATTIVERCYQQMFYGCTSLNYVEVAITEWNKYGAVVSQNWLYNVAASGTFTCPSTLSDIRDASHIPEGWTKVDAA